MSGTVWLNGRLLAAAAARIDPADRGFTLGDGVFETIAVRGGAPRHVERHFARLRDGAATLGIALEWSDAALLAAMAALVAGERCGEVALRLTVTRGPAARGVLPVDASAPTVLMSCGPLPSPAAPARVIFARATCRNERSPLSRIKSLNYLDGILARLEAARRGADDAILLDTRGHVAEATAATLLLLLDGAVVTPPVGDGALPGIARGLILEAGAAAERSLVGEDLARADAALLVNALGLREVATLEGRALAAGHAALAPCRAISAG